MGNDPVPVAPTKTGIAPNVLEDYFKSIEKLFLETQEGIARDTGPSGTFIVGFIFCLIPAIPYLLYRLLHWRLGPRLVSLKFLHLNLTSFWFVWLACFVLSLTILIVAAKFAGPSKEEKGRWLSPQEMRFAYCYAAISEIRDYKTNQHSRHIDKAVEYLQMTASSLALTTDQSTLAAVYESMPSRRELVYFQGGAVTMSSTGRPKWYRLRPETELILKGFSEFIPKLRDRLKDKNELVAVEAALTDLAGYQYTEIPEISGNQTQANFAQVGEESLLSFAQQIVGLSPYTSEPPRQTPKEKLSQKISSIGHRLSLPFRHENVLVAFFAWYPLMILLFAIGFYVAFRLVPNLKMDTTIATALVGGPITTAVAAVTIPRLMRPPKSHD